MDGITMNRSKEARQPAGGTVDNGFQERYEVSLMSVVRNAEHQVADD